MDRLESVSVYIHDTQLVLVIFCDTKCSICAIDKYEPFIAIVAERLTVPKVSVLMPTYNSVLYLREAIESVLDQTLAEFEFIIIDDGSTDETSIILAQYERIDERIKLIRNNNRLGIVASLNIGMSACCSKYIARMDSDDVALPDRLELQVAYMDKHPDVAALGGAVSYIDKNGNELGVIRHCCVGASPVAGNPLLHPTVVLRRKILVRHNIRYQKRYQYAEDYFLWLEIGCLAGLDALDEVILKYRLHGQASRIVHLKRMMVADLLVKKDAVMRLKIKPTARDVLGFCLESMLLLLPASIVYHVYRRFVLRVNI